MKSKNLACRQGRQEKLKFIIIIALFYKLQYVIMISETLYKVHVMWKRI
jgi:hypothetical protein